MATPAAILSLLVKAEGAQAAAAQLTRLEGAARKTATAADRSAGSLMKAGASARSAASGFSLMSASAQRSQQSVEGFARSIGRAARYGGLAGALGLGKAIKDGISFNATMEQNRIAFTGFLGSAKAANKELRVLYQLAKTTPFEFTDVTLASRKLMAMGFTVKEANKELRLLADAASGAALGADGIDRMVLALGQIKSKGILQMEDLRQLQELGVINFKQLGADLGLTAKELGNVGKVGVPAAAAIEAINRQFAGPMFAGQSAKQAQTLNGQVSTLRDNYRQFVGSLTTTAFDVSKTIFGKLNKALTEINAEYRAHPKLSLSAKVEIAKDKLAPVAREIVHTLGDQIQKAQLGDKIVSALDKAIPVVAKAGGHLGLALVRSFARAFVEGDALTRLALGAFFISKFAGWGNIFKSLGKMAGKRFAAQYAASSAVGIGAEMATEGAIGSSVAGAAALGKWRKFGRLAGRAAGGAAALAIALEINKQMGDKRSPLAQIINPLGNLVGLGVGANAPKGGKIPKGYTFDISTGYLIPKGTPKGFNDPAVVPKGAFTQRRAANAAAARYGIPADLLWGVYGVETGHGSNVTTSSAGAKGAFQFMPGTAPGYNYPYTNKQTPDIFSKQALGAAHYLSDLLKRFHGNVAAALNAYSGGGYTSVPGFRSAAAQPKAGGKINYKPLGGAGVGAKGKDNTAVETAALDNAIKWLQDTYPGIGYLLEDKGGKNQHLHINSAKHKQIREIARKLNEMGFNVGEYGGKPIPGIGGITTLKHKHYGAADHYHGGAIDVNADQLIRIFSQRNPLDKPGANVFKAPQISQADFMSFIQSRFAHFDLMVRAGLLSATKATLKKGAFLKTMLAGGALRGDTKLEAIAMLRELKIPTAAQQTWTPEAKRRLAMAVIQANPGNVGNLPAGVLKAAGPYATMQNPWMQAYQQNLTNQVGAGALTQGQADQALVDVLTKSLPFLTGQDAADVRTTLHTIATNTKDAARAALDTANSVRAGGISDAEFLGGLTGPAAAAVLGALAPYGINSLPGGGSIGEIGNSAAAVALAQGDIATLMEEVNSGQVAFADVWPQILSDLRVIASGAEASAEASNAATDAVNALKDEVKRQTDFATSVANTEAGAMARWVTEVISKQMGNNIGGRGLTPAYGVARRP